MCILSDNLYSSFISLPERTICSTRLWSKDSHARSTRLSNLHPHKVYSRLSCQVQWRLCGCPDRFHMWGRRIVAWIYLLFWFVPWKNMEYERLAILTSSSKQRKKLYRKALSDRETVDWGRGYILRKRIVIFYSPFFPTRASHSHLHFCISGRDCGEVLTTANGLANNASARCRGDTTYGGTNCIGTCDPGFIGAPTTFVCQMSGVWAPTTNMSCLREWSFCKWAKSREDNSIYIYIFTCAYLCDWQHVSK